jgi:hypothetical protein
VKRSGTLNHYVGDLLHTMRMSKLSRVRTETFQLLVIPFSAPHPVQTNCQSPRHGNFGDLSTSSLGRVHRHVSPAFTVYVVPFTEAVAVMVETNGRITTGAGRRQVATFPLRDTHEAES